MHQEGNLIAHREVVNSPLATYATEDIIAEADMDIINFKRPAGQSIVEYAQALIDESHTLQDCLQQVPSERNIY